jgi:hypothetical protein
MTGRAIAFVAGRRHADAGSEAPAGLRRVRGGAVDVLCLPRSGPDGPRDRLRAVLAAHRILDPVLPLSPRREVRVEDALAIAERAADRLLQRLHEVAEVCEVDVVWEAHPSPGRDGSAPPARGAAWLRARAGALADADRRCAALRARAEDAGACVLWCRAGQGRGRAVLASPRAGLGLLCGSLRAAARDPALCGASVLVTGPWPAFTLAGDVVAEAA